VSHDQEEARVLAAARRTLEPTAADAERVLSSLRHAVALGAVPAVHANDAAPQDTPKLGDVMRRVAGVRATKLVAALCLAGASGAVGYSAGLGAGHEQAAHEDRGAQRASSREHDVALPHEKPAPRAASPQEPAAQPSARATGLPSSSPRSARAPSTRNTNVAGPHAARGPSLEEETRMLARVERALRERNPQQALVLLGELDRNVPGGQLVEERLAAFIMARCSLGLGSPALLVREFSQRHPGSVYFARVRQTCDTGESAVLPTEP
jgi:hypothetical protein